MKARIKVLLALTLIVVGLTTWTVLDSPGQVMPERTIGIVYRGHHASYTLPAEYGRSLLLPYTMIAWMLYLQGAVPLCLHPWEKKCSFGHSLGVGSARF